MNMLRVIDLGLIPHSEALARQAEAADCLRGGGPATLFLLEHPPTITFGRHSGEENLPFSADFFIARGVDLVKTSRGGNITCHFPGQLVVYPIMRVERKRGGVHGLVNGLEECVIRTLNRFGLNAARSNGRPGVWINERKKICSIGLAFKHWISSHGLSLNVARDLSLFESVTPCGLPGVQATSIHRELDMERPTMPEVKRIFTQEFRTIYGYAE